MKEPKKMQAWEEDDMTVVLLETPDKLHPALFFAF